MRCGGRACAMARTRWHALDGFEGFEVMMACPGVIRLVQPGWGVAHR